MKTAPNPVDDDGRPLDLVDAGPTYPCPHCGRGTVDAAGQGWPGWRFCPPCVLTVHRFDCEAPAWPTR